MSWKDAPISQEKILEICRRINPKGECFKIHRFKYGADNNRKRCFKLKKKGLLRQARGENRFLYFYLPEFEDRVTED